MDADIYVCSKPLQYFNVRNIKYQSYSAKKILVFLGHFSEAEAFSKSVKKYDDLWDDVLYFENFLHWDFYLFFHPINTLFVECDASFIYGIFYKMRRFKQMFMFEEGFGSYRRDRFDQSKGLKKWINNLTGVGYHIGFSKFLTGQYLYLPDLYKQQFPGYNKILRPFQKSFVEKLNQDLSLFLKCSTGYEEFYSFKNKTVAIYLTNHKINSSIIDLLLQEQDNYDCVYIKPHPHIKNIEQQISSDIKIVQSNIMIEFLLLILLEGGNKLTVFHENSTSIIWFQNKVVNKNLGRVFKEYDIVSSYINSREILP